jgi:hypothetical protein
VSGQRLVMALAWVQNRERDLNPRPLGCEQTVAWSRPEILFMPYRLVPAEVVMAKPTDGVLR